MNIESFTITFILAVTAVVFFTFGVAIAPVLRTDIIIQ